MAQAPGGIFIEIPDDTRTGTVRHGVIVAPVITDTGLQLQIEKAAPSTARGCFIYIHGVMIEAGFISILAELAHSFAGVIVPEE
ncbi:MAG: hypothetical protein WBE80_17025 [Methylocella sp.]